MGNVCRREMLQKLALSSAMLGGVSFEDNALLAQLVDRSEYGKVKEAVKGLQRGQFGKYEVSRLIIGGNLISGSAHAGELLYQSALMTHYFTTEKILETWQLAEQNGINTTLMRSDPHILEHYRKFTHERNGKLQWIAQTAPEQGDPVENAKRARDGGAIAAYHHGFNSDRLVKEGKVGDIGRRRLGIGPRAFPVGDPVGRVLWRNAVVPKQSGSTTSRLPPYTRRPVAQHIVGRVAQRVIVGRERPIHHRKLVGVGADRLEAGVRSRP